MIDGVKVVPLKRISDERGMVMHMLRSDAPHFAGFGEVYFSVVYDGVVKGWHLHSKMTLNYACVAGAVKVGLYDERAGSPTRGKTMELVLDETDYRLVVIPPGVWNGFRGLDGRSIVANCASIPYDPAEIARRDPFDKSIPFDWGVRHG